MQYVIGIEAKPLLLELDDFRIFLLTIAPPQLVHGNLYIYEEVKDAEEAAELLSDADLMEEKHQLARTDGTRGEEFYDYGFHAAGVFFLYLNELSAFKIVEGDTLQREMALIQLGEHLVFTSTEGIYFTISHYHDLILGIVKAYNVKVEFLDLDK